MKLLGYSPSYQQGRDLARSQGFSYAHVVASNEAPLRYSVIVQEERDRELEDERILELADLYQPYD